MNWNVLSAIFKRNFVSYFSSPTGYVFICVFVSLSSLAAFWPTEFFNANLANLDQLSAWFPLIMLAFIPAITMSIWAEERRQGTDELLLTIPATDTEVVLGKFIAALAIFSVSLAFSMFSNYCVLAVLGEPDAGLFVGTYIGYWLIGMTMLSVGMVASFLTSNLTVGFILGAVFNAPLALSGMAETIIPQAELAQTVEQWSLTSQFRDFERGVISISSASYFVLMTAVMVYLSVVLIGRRHWRGGRDGSSMLGHYLLRTLSLLLMAIGVTWFFSNHDVIRADITSARLSSLSPDTKKLVKNLKTDYPVQIEAFVSPRVPTEYVQAKLNLLSTLDELESLAGGKIQVTTHVLENFSREAAQAEEKYGIKPQTVAAQKRGARGQDEIFLGVAFTSGLEKVVIPFLDKGVPTEYELIRSIATVAQQKRRKVGIVKTDASLFGSFNMQMMSSLPDQAIIDELKKQYDVVEVDPANPIDDRYDVLMAVQPSSLAPEQLENLIAAVKAGQPTAIFEDPFPYPPFWQSVPATSEPRRSQQNPMTMFGGRQQPPPPKGNINDMWKVLGVEMVDDQVVWQNYNPYPKYRDIPYEFVFIDEANGNAEAFNNQETITDGLQQVLFLYPGSWRKMNTSKLKFVTLAETGNNTGTIGFQDLRGGQGLDIALSREPTQSEYVIAVRVRGKLPPEDLLDTTDDENKFGLRSATPVIDGSAEFCADEESADEETSKNEAAEKEDARKEETDKQESEKAKTKNVSEDAAAEEEEPAHREGEIDVVLVADIDCLVSVFFQLRASGTDDEIQWNFDNVTFVLNVLDELAGDDRFIDIRKRRRPHRTLKTIDVKTEDAKSQAAQRREEFNNEFDKARAEAQQKFNEKIQKIDQRKDLDPIEKQQRIEILRQSEQRKLDIFIERQRQERDREIKRIERELELQVRKVQDSYKLWALALPPIPPLVLAFFMYFHRRAQEREGVARSRFK